MLPKYWRKFVADKIYRMQTGEQGQGMNSSVLFPKGTQSSNHFPLKILIGDLQFSFVSFGFAPRQGHLFEK